MSEPIFIERWEVEYPQGYMIEIAYTKSKCPTYEYLLMLRKCMEEEHNCKLKHLIRTDVIQTEREVER